MLVSPSTCWQPQDFLPDSASPDFYDAVQQLRQRSRELPLDYLVVLVGDMVTEEALPSYMSMLNRLKGTGDESGMHLSLTPLWSFRIHRSPFGCATSRGVTHHCLSRPSPPTHGTVHYGLWLEHSLVRMDSAVTSSQCTIECFNRCHFCLEECRDHCSLMACLHAQQCVGWLPCVLAGKSHSELHLGGYECFVRIDASYHHKA